MKDLTGEIKEANLKILKKIDKYTYLVERFCCGKIMSLPRDSILHYKKRKTTKCRSCASRDRIRPKKRNSFSYEDFINPSWPAVK